MYKINKEESLFIEDLVPGNYWITKSMEFTRKNSSGTLWYLKKFLVYYYFLFFTKKFTTKQGLDEIIAVFDSFIDSLPATVRPEAEGFFYSTGVNLKSADFKNFVQFTTHSSPFSNEKDSRTFMNDAKKFYFAYLMELGGQSGTKKELKQILSDARTYESFLEKAQVLFDDKGLMPSERRQTLGDYHASLRNERQMFFYYGFFHGMEASSLEGFYKLTPIGRAVLYANFHELLLVWEHQKIKMVSQTPATKIQNLEDLSSLEVQEREKLVQKVANLNHPYLVFLELFKELGSINQDDYKFIISRAKNFHSIELLTRILKSAGKEGLIKKIEAKALVFGRRGDNKDEDFEKERKKFLLGIMELPKDQGTNYFSFIDEDSEKVVNSDRCDFILKVYKSLAGYLDSTEGEKYASFSVYLQRYYAKEISVVKSAHLVSLGVEFDWYNYIINFNQAVMMVLMYVGIRLQINDFKVRLTSKEIGMLYKVYGSLLQHIFGIKKRVDIDEIIEVIDNHYLNDQLDAANLVSLSIRLGGTNFDYESHQSAIANVTLVNLKEVSNRNALKASHERDFQIISMLRGFYIKNYVSGVGLIPCDSCGQGTFMTARNQAFLEFHHIIPFSIAGGPDHYSNLVGICPLCHKKFHHLNYKEMPDLYRSLDKNNNPKTSLMVRLEQLYQDDVLEPIHLSYLVKEGALSQEMQSLFLARDVIIR